MAICNAESGGVAQATNWNDSHSGCSGSFGLMQTACLYTTDDITVADLFDPSINIRVAYSVYKRQGWDAWRNSFRKVLANS